jgi:cupin fold WbuC family metalloprotein
MNDIIVNTDDVLEVGTEIIDRLKQLALASPRRRARLCLHRQQGELPHEMVIVFHRDSYMPPHRHPPGKTESYHVVEGAMLVHIFDDAGELRQTLRLGGTGGTFMYRLSSNLWHMPVALTEWLVYHEVYSGPFDKTHDVEFPSWAPAEHEHALIPTFCSRLPQS